MKILCTGSRSWPRTSVRIIESVIASLSKDCMIVHGGAKGADSYVDGVSRDRGLRVKIYRADWDKYGRSAGLIRNVKMLDEEKPTLVIAFLHEDDKPSKGTRHAIRQALQRNIPLFVFGTNGQQIANENFI